MKIPTNAVYLQENFSADDVERELREMYRHLFDLRVPLDAEHLQSYLILLDMLCPALREYMSE